MRIPVPSSPKDCMILGAPACDSMDRSAARSMISMAAGDVLTSKGIALQAISIVSKKSIAVEAWGSVGIV